VGVVSGCDGYAESVDSRARELKDVVNSGKWVQIASPQKKSENMTIWTISLAASRQQDWVQCRERIDPPISYTVVLSTDPVTAIVLYSLTGTVPLKVYCTTVDLSFPERLVTQSVPKVAFSVGDSQPV